VTRPDARVGLRRRRSLGMAAVLAALVAGAAASHGCVDDRAKVAQAVFFCNPSSRSADADCGKGFVCYSAVQSLGGSICVPACDPAQPASCKGVCTATGACLAGCKVPGPGQPDGCPPPLICRRTTISPSEAQLHDDGVCLPINSSCTSSLDCTSPVFNECTSSINGATQGAGLLPSGEICVQGRCSALGVSCEPGSACVKDIIPAPIPAPDFCSPICSSARKRPDGGVLNECVPGMTCLSDAFPSLDAPACAPGFPGWLCVDDLGCTAGKCEGWGDVDPRMKDFDTCSPICKSDDDCVAFDRGGNPNVITRNTCHNGYCRNLQSLFFPLTCLKSTDRCQLDPDRSQCVLLTSPRTAGDMGTGSTCGKFDPMNTGLGAFGGQALTCARPCTTRSDCDDLSKTMQVPLTCLPTATAGSRCLPPLPFMTPCNDDGDCFGDLTCQVNADNEKVCSRPCTSSADCAQDPALGGTFACAKICVPKVESGCPATTSDQCISGRLGGPAAAPTCKSPLDWACNKDEQCESGHCVIIDGTSPPFGRCE
jgi:hypothetical protein